MVWLKRIFLFAAVNILVVLTISILAQFLGLTGLAGGYGSFFAFCLFYGFAGAFISLAVSRMAAKWMMRVQVIDANTRDPGERELLQLVYRLAQGASLPKLPEVGIYQSPEVNAFATGPTKARSLVAVSTGLLQRMRPDEIEGVLGHEVAHIANGDMVTMTLVQGVVNAFILFFARIVAAVAGQNVQRGNRHAVEMLVYFTLQIVFGILGSLVVAAFSRYREFRADMGGASLAGRPKMIAALQALQGNVALVENQSQAIQAFKISSGRSRLAGLFSTHPPLEERIARLREMRG